MIAVPALAPERACRDVAGRRQITSRFDGDVVTEPVGLRTIGRQARELAEVKIAPGETKSLTYKYERYVPSR